jgi:hypothetical protein
MLYGDGMTGSDHGNMQGMSCVHCCRRPHVTTKRSSGRLSLLLQRDSADVECWVGRWRLMVNFKARLFDAMVMFTPDSLLAPVAAGTLRGPKYSRLLVNPKERRAQRNVAHVSAHVLDILPPVTNRNDNEACDLAVNVYARTRLHYSLVANNLHAVVGDSISVQVKADVLQGNANPSRTFARMISPVNDIAALAPKLNPNKINPDDLNREQQTPKFDFAKALAEAERRDRKIAAHKDQLMTVAIHDDGLLHVHIEKAPVAGPYNVSIYIEGDYCPDHDTAPGPGGADGHDHSARSHSHGGDSGGNDAKSECGPDCVRESFTRLLTAQVPVTRDKRQPATASKVKQGRKKGGKSKR